MSSQMVHKSPAVGEVLERHRVAGLDTCERGFNREAEIRGTERGCRILFRYETLFVETDERPDPGEAMADLVKRLQEHGYVQLRSQLSFVAGHYRGSSEPWVEYADFAGSAGRSGWTVRLERWLRHVFGGVSASPRAKAFGREPKP